MPVDLHCFLAYSVECRAEKLEMNYSCVHKLSKEGKILLVKLNGTLYAKCCVPGIYPLHKRVGDIDPQCQFHQAEQL